MQRKLQKITGKTISAILSLIMLITLMGSADVFSLKAFATDSDLIDFFNSSTAALAAGSNVVYTTDTACTGTPGSLKISVPSADKDVSTRMFSFSQNGFRTDWSDIDSISFVIHSQTANDEKLNIVFSKSSSTINNGYYFYCLNVDWSGWKKITVPTSSFSANRGIVSWSSVDAMYFNLGGWNAVSQTSTVLCISSVEAVSYSSISKEVLANSSAIYAGVNKAVKGNSELTLSKAPEYINEAIYAPMSMFSELSDFTSTSGSLSRGGLKIEFSDLSPIAKIGAYDYKLSHPAYLLNGEMCAPIADVCTLFEIPLHTDGRFAVFGSEENIDLLKAYEAFGLNQVSEHMVFGISPSASGNPTSADCEAVIENWLESMIGNEEINSKNDSTVTSKINSINSAANSAWNLLIKEEGSAELFEGIVTEASADMTTASLRIYQMAAGYGTYGAELYQNAELKEDILYALDWFYENRYGDDEAANNENAWRDRTLFNWHDWRIGTPKNLISTLMIMRNDLTDSELAKYLECFEAVAPTISSSGANYINVCRLIIGAAALKGDAERVKEFIGHAEKTFIYVDNGRNPENQLDAARAAYTPERGHGFYKDGSYVYHTLHSMNGTYGLENLNIGADFLSLFEGTAFEMSKYCSDNIADWIVNSFDAIIYKNKMPRMFLGRGNNPSETSQARTVVSAALKCFGSFDDDDKQRVGSIIKELSNHNLSSFISGAPVSKIDLLKEIASSDEYNSYNYSNSNILANVDKAMHKRPDWAVGISMSSSRIFNYESINGENLTGWYLGDGRTQIYLQDEGTSSEYSYWKNIDYYRLPGTTVDTQQRKEVSIAQGNEYLSTKDFVGGAELDGKYITAAMHLESYHNETDYGVDKNSYGTLAPAHQSDLTAKKSYFAFDNEIFCLGAEVNAKANNNADVLTVVENRILNASGFSVLEIGAPGDNFNSSRFSLAEHGVPTDWSKAQKVVIPIYSTEANNDYLNIQLCKGVENLSDGYIHKQIQLNWSGWKNIEIAVDSNSKWKTVNSMYFNVGGWSPPTQPQATTKLYFDDVTVLNSDGSVLATVDFGKSFTAQKASLGFSADSAYGEHDDNVASDIGNITLSAADTNPGNVTWLNLDGRIGYYFPGDGTSNPGELKIRCKDNNFRYFEAIFDHGVNPTDSSYAYALLPNMDSYATAEYAANSPVEILSNTGSVQAVRNNELGITSIVFWEAGSFDGITVSDPMIVMLKESETETTLAVSDPTQKLTNATVKINRIMLLSDSDSRITQSNFGTSSTFAVDFTETLGATLQATLKHTEPVALELSLTDSDSNACNRYLAHKENTVKATISVTNLSDTSSNIRFIIAMYDANGKLQDAQTLTKTVLKGRTQKMTEVTLTPTADTALIKGFVWEKGTLKPFDSIYINN